MRIVWMLVAVLSLLFWGFGVFDMWATLTSWPPYEEQYGADLFAWIQGFPLWRKAIWGASIALGVIGSLSMFARMRLAGHALFAAFLLMAIGFAYDLAFQDGVRQYRQAGLIASGALVTVALLFALAGYARARRATSIDKPVANPTPSRVAPAATAAPPRTPTATPPATPSPAAPMPVAGVVAPAAPPSQPAVPTPVAAPVAPAAPAPQPVAPVLAPASPPAPETAGPDATPPPAEGASASAPAPPIAAPPTPPLAAPGNPDEPAVAPPAGSEPSSQDPRPPAA